MEEKLISGIQQVGIGVADAAKAFRWYRHAFGMDIPVFDDSGRPLHMLRYTGGVVQERRAILAANLRGGGGFEIWQYTSRSPASPGFEAGIGDLGILWPKMKAMDIERAHREISASDPCSLSPVVQDPGGGRHYYVVDPWGNRFDVVESFSWFAPRSGRKGTSTGGVAGCTIGVSDVAHALTLYRDILGYDTVLRDSSGVFEDFAPLPGGTRRVRRLVLGHAAERGGAFSRWLGPSTIELVEPLIGMGRRVFTGRLWGDLGFIHLCFDVRGMSAIKRECADRAYPFTVDSAESFGMGAAAGRFAYLEDQDGTLIELVESHRIPVLKRLGWYVDLSRRRPRKPLPRFVIRALGLARVRD